MERQERGAGVERQERGRYRGEDSSWRWKELQPYIEKSPFNKPEHTKPKGVLETRPICSERKQSKREFKVRRGKREMGKRKEGEREANGGRGKEGGSTHTFRHNYYIRVLLY